MLPVVVVIARLWLATCNRARDQHSCGGWQPMPCQEATRDRQWCRLRQWEADVAASPRIRYAPIRKGVADSNTGPLGSLEFAYGGRASLLAGVEDPEGTQPRGCPKDIGDGSPRLAYTEVGRVVVRGDESIPSGSWMVTGSHGAGYPQSSKG